MKIDILDINELIRVNDLKEVTSPALFTTGQLFDDDGILSNEIFGTSSADRRTTFAYIDLHRHFIHPHIYEKVLKPIFRNIIYLMQGSKRFEVHNGVLVESENGWTGIDELYKHWDEIVWVKNKQEGDIDTALDDINDSESEDDISDARPEEGKMDNEEKISITSINRKLLKNLRKDQVFIDKLLVCPPGYRDVMRAGTVDASQHVDPVNSMYTNVIRTVSTFKQGGIFAARQYASQMKVQLLLVDIMNYFKNMISRKQGLIRKNLMGKSIDYGSRSVISAPSYNFERLEDSMVDVEHVALPIEHCCSNFYPFMVSWVSNFFMREVINDPNAFHFTDPNTGNVITAQLKDPEIQFSEKKIRKIIDDYCKNPDNRFSVVTIQVVKPEEKGNVIYNANLRLKGKIINGSREDLLNRPMTYTDILYLAAVDVCEKRHVMVSRYPVGTDKGIYFNKIRVQSTQNHIHLVLNGKEYPYYPDIDLKTPTELVGTKFIDTLVYANAHLEGMGADYDGDTVSIRGIWSDEANLEAEELMNTKMTALNITGKNAKVVSKELIDSMYELTKDGKNPRKVTANETTVLLGLQFDGITRSKLVDLFADRVDNSNGTHSTNKHKPRFNTWDTMTIPAKYFYPEQKEIETTVGRFIFNKFVLEGSGIIGATKYMNNVLSKNPIGDLDNHIATLYMKDIIDRNQFNAYTDRRDCLGYWLAAMLIHSISERMLKPLPEVEKLKKELITKYKKELEEKNLDVMNMIVEQLIAKAKEVLKDDPGMDLYTSGDLNFNNNYRNNSIIKGAVMNQITGEYDFIPNSLMDGIEIKDIPAHANGILAAQYPASIATQDAGYMGKKLLSMLQMVEVDEPGTDCGTKRLSPVTITNYNKSNMYYTYIQDGEQEVMLDETNINRYVGKRVMMRSPQLCLNNKICAKCAGNLFYMLNTKNIGLFSVAISHADLNLGLKSKHDTTVNLYSLNPDDIIKNI